MTDIRLARYAHLLVNYCVDAQPGQMIGIFGDVVGLPLLRALHHELIEAGAHPLSRITDATMIRDLLRYGNDDQLDWADPIAQIIVEQTAGYIGIRANANTRAMTRIPAERIQRARKAQAKRQQTFLARDASGELNWTLAQFPTEADAQEANMSLEDYADFVYGATFADHDDPVAEWQKLAALQQKQVDFLTGKGLVDIKGPNVDLQLSIKDRTWINDDGHRNMPGGEIFTSPVEESVVGWVRFTYPSLAGGRPVSGIELRFEDGKVVEAHATENDDLLQAQLNTDVGARYLGEFAIGTNYGITHATGNTLFDEKIGGTIHLAIGASYPTTGGKNESAVHWDMVCDMREDSTIYIDGEMFYKNGQFVQS